MDKDSARRSPAPASAGAPVEAAFGEVVSLILGARQRAAQAVNTELIDLYWRIGQTLHHKIEADGWAKGTVVQLAAYIAQREPGMRGFSAQNLWRMRQFFQAYPAASNLSALLRELPWSSHLHILGRTKRPEEREFYLRLATQHRWQVREVARQIDSGLFERAVLNPPKLSTALREMQPQAEQHFKDAYLLEFLALPDLHSEADLHRSLLLNLGRFLTELGRDFCYIGSEYPVQVGGQDFALDLLFFHRALNCLVAIELKVTAFETTLSGRGYLRLIDQWQAMGYSVKLIFLQLASPEEAIARVALRVSQGGHHIPAEVVRRRFLAGHENFHRLYAPRVQAWAGGVPSSGVSLSPRGETRRA